MTVHLRIPIVSVDEVAAAGRADLLPADLARIAAAGARPPGAGRDVATAGEIFDAFMHTRATRAARPVRLSVTVTATIGHRRRLTIPARPQLTVTAALGDGAIRALVDRAVTTAGPDLVRLRRNPTLRRAGARYEFRTWQGSGLVLSTVSASTAIDAVLAACGEHGTGRTGAAAALAAASPSTPAERFDAFLDRLIDAGVLLADLATTADSRPERAWEILTAATEEEVVQSLHGLQAGLGQEQPLQRYLAEGVAGVWQRYTASLDGLLADVPVGERLRVRIGTGADRPAVDHSSLGVLRKAYGRVLSLVDESPRQAALDAAFRTRHGDGAVPVAELLDLEAELADLPWRSGRSGEAAERTCARALAHWVRTGEPFDLLAGTGRPDSPRDTGVTDWIHAALLDEYEGRYCAVLFGGYHHPPQPLLQDFGVLPEETGGTPEPGDVLVSLTPGTGPELWDRRTGDRVQPRSGRSGEGPQRMLDAMLQPFLDPGPVQWTWGALGEELPHLPRVVAGRVIVAPERWRLSDPAVEDILDAPDVGAGLRAALPGLGNRRWLAFAGRGQTLPVDTSAPAAVELALQALSNPSGVTCQELPHFESPVVSGGSGRHTAHLLLPPERDPRPRTAPAQVPPTHQLFRARVEYQCRSTAVDELPGLVGAVMEKLAAEGCVAQWSYEWHGLTLRIDCRVADAEQRPTAVAGLDRFGLDLVASGQVVRAAVVPAAPNVDVHGGPDVLCLAEEVHRADSLETAGFLAGRPTDKERLRRCVDDFLAWLPLLDRRRDEHIAIVAAVAAAVPAKPQPRAVPVPARSALPSGDCVLEPLLTQYACRVDDTNGRSRRAFAALLTSHGARIFPVDLPTRLQEVCDLVVRALRADTGSEERKETAGAAG
ncbi:lantibiotic dehydratase [Kitasatospora sp. NPDC091335]|uniref:lantibiotic dehydratase n=1 Tax=Kitasatospora sp. NPDC091335 TaxID=3364085 RepID=UPI0038139EB5